MICVGRLVNEFPQKTVALRELFEVLRMRILLLLSMFYLSAMGQLPSQDIMALLEFKKGIKHDPTGFVLNSWNDESIDFNGCPSSWNGIVCNGGNVAGVVLDNLGLSADADFSLFSNLTMLVKLSMANNSISGVLPSSLSSFKSLQFLDLSDNLFSSSLPEEFGRSVASLKNLSLAGNNFSGEIPESVGELVSLQSLDMSRNSLSGPLPKSLTRLNELLYLNLSSNGFTGKIPRGFELISSLQVLDLHGNFFDGDLDGEFFILTNASYVDFSGNRLVTTSGKLVPGVSESIKHLNLSHNQLEGSLTSGFQLFQNLKVLDLSYNELSGELPGFNYVYDLQVLKLSNNRFSGSLPNNLLKGDSLLLTTLDLSGNSLSGAVSDIMSTTLHTLDLSSNSLTGELPLLTGSCVLLDLSNNQFEGNLTRWSKWENVEYLDLSQNRFTGSFPDVTPQLLRANHLNLSYNKLTGSLPDHIPTQYPKLRVLDISSNSLEGPIPSALLSMPTLEEIHLQNNGMVGNIGPLPPSSGSRIRLLDLSHNRFDGDLPGVLGTLTSLQVLNLAANSLSGSLPDSMNDMVSLSSLDVSQNHFTGPLPSNLSRSLVAFNVSYNDLSGTVPENLRSFPPSSLYPGNSKLILPAGSNASESSKRKKPRNLLIKVVIIVSCAIALIILILVAILLFCICKSRRQEERGVTGKDINRRTQTIHSGTGGGMVISAEDLAASRKGSSSEILSPDEKLLAVATGFSPSKTSNLSWSPGSGDSFPADQQQLARLDVRSPDRLVGELQFLDDSIKLTPEELSRAPAEVLGRSSHGTSYRATLDNGVFLTVKWLREGVAKQRKEFAKEVKKFANIRHPNVVTLRGYYWGPTQHEKLILSDYISPGSLASFLYDRPGKKGPPLAWIQRLKIAVDVARGLNYLHFDRAVPHGNLKATNILLDGAELNARVADYCLHRLMTQAGTVEQIVDAGILGYRAPELAASRKPLPSFKSDVYAFGVILLEILTGRCAGDVITGEQEGVDLTDWVRLRVAEGRGAECFDSVLTQEMGSDPVTEKGTKEVLGIALSCIRSVSERPGIKTIYEDLSSI